MRRLTPGRILAAARARLVGARYLAEDVLFVAGRFLRRAPWAIRDRALAAWDALAIRGRIAAALLAVAAAAAVIALATGELPCEVPGGEGCPPADSAAALVPAGALAYAHLDLDSGREQTAGLGEVVGRVPTLTEQLLGGAAELAPDVELTFPELVLELSPWLGDEAALALLRGAEGRERVWLLAATDPGGAAEFARRLTGGANVAEHRGVELEVDGSGTLAAAQVGGFLAIGGEAAVRAVIDVAAGADEALADDEVATEVWDELPPERAADVYMSADGVEELIAGGTGVLSSLSPLAMPEAARGVGVALGAEDGELALAVRSVLEPERARAEPGFFGAFAPFEPGLPGELPADALAYVGFGDPEATVAELLAQAGAEAPGVARGFEGLVAELRRDGEIDIERQLLPALGDEAGFVIEPRAADPESPFATAPLLELVARGVDVDAAREALARLQRPVVRALKDAIELPAPVFSQIEVGGVEAQTLPVSPAIDLTYAIVDDLAVIATDPAGVEQLTAEGPRLDGADSFEQATAGFEDEVSMLAYFDVRGLVSLAERLGLAEDPVYAAFAGEIRSLVALGIAVRRSEDLLATDARLIVEMTEQDAPLAPPEPELPSELDRPSEPESAPELDDSLPGLELPDLGAPEGR